MSDLLEQLKETSNTEKELLIKKGKLIEKGLKSRDPQVVTAANAAWQDVANRMSSESKSTMLDPNEWSRGAGYRQQKSLHDYTLRKMADTPVIKAIITTLQTKVTSFARPQKSKFDKGFVIRRKPDHYSSDIVKKAGDEKVIKQITDFILNCGRDSNSWHGDTFDTFLKKFVADSLILDKACFEVVRNKLGKPIEFLAVDGGTIRIADTYDEDDKEFNNRRERAYKRGYLPSTVQLIDGTIRAEFYPWELCFGTRNTTSDIRNNAYGRSEVEQLISIITWMLFGDSYNGKFFSQGSHPKGLLKVSKNTNRNRLNEFRQQWLSMLQGLNGAWKIPIIESDKMEWIDLQKNNTDMQFGKWQEYLIKVACAVFCISPEECGFNLGNAGGGGGLFQGSDEHKLNNSRDKGLVPLLKFVETCINKYIVNAIHPEFEFAFVGQDAESESNEIDANIKKVTNFMGVEEIRKAMGLGALPEDDIILNPQWIQHQANQQMAEQQEQNNEAVAEDQGGPDTDVEGLTAEDFEFNKALNILSDV